MSVSLSTNDGKFSSEHITNVAVENSSFEFHELTANVKKTDGSNPRERLLLDQTAQKLYANRKGDGSSASHELPGRPMTPNLSNTIFSII